MVQNYSPSKAWMSFVTHPHQHLFKRIMSDALVQHGRRVSIGSRNITNLELADDTDALAEEEQELEALVESIDKGIRRRSVLRRPD